MAASAERHRVPLRARRGYRPVVEHYRHRRLGRAEAARGAFPAVWKLQRAGPVGPACGGAIGKSDRGGTDRASAPANGGLRFERDVETRGGVLAVALSYVE